MSTRQRAQLAMTEERTREGSRAMTIQTNIRQRIGSIEKMKALLAACLMMVATLLAASLLAPGPAQASAFPGANGKIVFSSDRTTGTGVHNPEGDLEIFSMNPDGTALKQLTKNTAGDFNPSYSSDGKKIAFSSARAGNLDVFVMNAGGTNQTDITPNTRGEINPDWQPVAATFTVTSDVDPGDGVCNATSCTLREAINASNNLQSQIQNKIKFTISGGGVRTIAPTTDLPQITSPVLIDGYTQPASSPNTLTSGTNAAPKIELNGTNASGNGTGFVISGTSNCVIRGLIINRFLGNSISLFNGTANNRIEGNFLHRPHRHPR